MAIIRSTLALALLAISAGTSISNVPSRNVRRSFSGVIIFMYRHDACGFMGMNFVRGLRVFNWWMIPISVATSTSSAVVASAIFTMAPVDRIWVRSFGRSPTEASQSTEVVQPHSGWTITSAFGCSATCRRTSAGLMPACTWHSPIQMCMFVRPV